MWQSTVSWTMRVSSLCYPLVAHPKHVFPTTTHPMSARVAAGSPTLLAIALQMIWMKHNSKQLFSADSQREDRAHMRATVDDTNDWLSTWEGKMSKLFYSENSLYTKKKNQYRFSHRELFYTSLQTYSKTLCTFSLGLLKSPSNVTAPLACQFFSHAAFPFSFLPLSLLKKQ